MRAEDGGALPRAGGTDVSLRVGYADPPYPGMSRFYRDHPDYAGELDHGELIDRLEADYDGWCLHTASTTLKEVLTLAPEGVRVMAWVKPFAIFKKHVSVAYSWEPVIVKPCRPRPFDGYTTINDWISEPITLRRGLTGVKPAAVCRWLFDAMGMAAEDSLDDMFPGSGAVADAWEAWRSQLRLGTTTGASPSPKSVQSLLTETM